MLLSISKQLKLLRTKMNMNQYEFAKFLSIKQPTLSAYERDISNPSLDVLLMISEKCNVSLDWLCGQNVKPRYYSLADIILAFLEVKELDGFDFKLNTEKQTDSVVLTDKYSCVISINGELKNSNSSTISTDDSMSYVCKFLYEWKNTIEQLKSLDDAEIKKNYYHMWLEKQLEFYSTIPVKTKSEASEEFSTLIYDSILGDNKLKLGE